MVDLQLDPEKLDKLIAPGNGDGLSNPLRIIRNERRDVLDRMREIFPEQLVRREGGGGGHFRALMEQVAQAFASNEAIAKHQPFLREKSQALNDSLTNTMARLVATSTQLVK